MKLKPVTVVIGAQYGSEGKGAIIGWMTDPQRSGPGPMLVIRTGGPQAGHSIMVPGPFEGKPGGKVYKMRQVPCAWPNPNAKLALGPGALVDLDVLQEEIDTIGYDNLKGRLVIDPMVCIVSDEHKEEEEESAKMRGIGSTKEGVGAAQAARVRRTAKLAQDVVWLEPLIDDVADHAHLAHNAGVPIIVESTQGYGLSLTRSGLYPTVTSRDITPGQVLNDAGVPINWDMDVIAVMRTYPIRVAGPSGPFGGEELTWEEMALRTDGYIKEPERTTVTKKIRRIAEFDYSEASRAIKHIQPTMIALTFFDYWCPSAAGKEVLGMAELQMVINTENQLGVRIGLVGTGFQTVVDRTWSK